jgi:hypothetical protein
MYDNNKVILCMIIYCMINIISQCIIRGSPVSDLVEPEVEKQGQLKAGHYVDNRWIYVMIACNLKLQVEIKKGEAIIIAIQ